MKFTQKYELLDPVPGEDGDSFQARQTTTGRDVTVHFLKGGETPENQGLLSRLRKLPLEALAKVIEVGDHNGAKFVVTIAPPYLRLDDWLTEHERAYRTTQDQQFTRAGAWKVPPALTGQTPAAPSSTPSSPTGEFAKMFEAPVAPAPTGKISSPPPSASEPGEFTKMFQAPAAAPTGKVPTPAPPPPKSEPGEFTKMFQAPAASPTAKIPTPAAPPPKSEPGEFTKMFQAPAAGDDAT